MATAAATTRPRFSLFRAAEARDFEESGIMAQAVPTEIEMAGAVAAIDAGMLEGTSVKLLFAIPGLSLTHAWFKSGFPLPRHTHDVDCLYYIVAGSLRIGVEDLARGDGFFVGAGVPYNYVPARTASRSSNSAARTVSTSACLPTIPASGRRRSTA